MARIKVPKKIRERVAKKFSHHCFYCGCSLLKKGRKIFIDHIIPVSRGGSNEENNLVPACFKCNMSKHMLLIEEWKAVKIQKRDKEKERWRRQCLIWEFDKSGMEMCNFLASKGLSFLFEILPLKDGTHI